MSYTPSTAAQTAATQAGNNMANLASPITVWQASIAAGNLVPASLIDAIITALNGYKCAAIYNTAAGQSIPGNIFTRINFGTQELDTDSAVTTGASWVFTVPTGKSGLYFVTAAAGFAPAVPGATLTALSVYINGAEKQRGNEITTGAGGDFMHLTVSGLFNLAVGDTIGIDIFQSNGVNQTLAAAGAENRVSIFRVVGA